MSFYFNTISYAMCSYFLKRLPTLVKQGQRFQGAIRENWGELREKRIWDVLRMILGIYGLSNSGKTTLIEQLVMELTRRGFTVSTIKHTRGAFSLDTPGKDTDRHRKAGAMISGLISASETALISSTPLSLEKTIELINAIEKPDVLLVEGAKTEKIPKVAVGDIEAQEGTIFRYQNNLEEILDFVIHTVKAETLRDVE